MPSSRGSRGSPGASADPACALGSDEHTHVLIASVPRGRKDSRRLRAVGAAGDLAALPQLARVVMGQGDARRAADGERLPGAEALRRVGLEPLAFEAKEGISLVNGTQCMTSIGALALLEAERAARLSD